MSTIYVWDEETSADTTGSALDYALIYDVSAGRTKKVRLGSVAFGGSATGTLGFYGVTAVDQGTFTGTALTALTAATISAANTSSVFGFGSSTVAKAYVKRMAQIQADLETLMGKVESTGLVAIAGVP
jgi:hypothetical protein